MAKTRYQFTVNTYGPDVDPQAIGEQIEELIDKRNEHVTHEELIAAGRALSSALHACFTYDDALAADKWRKHEAGRLTRNLHLADKHDPDKAGRTRAFVYVNHPEHEGKRVLLTTRSAMARTEFREQVILQAVRQLQRSLTNVRHTLGGYRQYRALLKDVDKLRKRAERELLQAI
ncbi:MAG TPA: hypothetical protein VJN70_12545 [Gemmatimonadaceae bacterium]|nr:hypothetical protein [Gemmatimonadaceae bacterium]